MWTPLARGDLLGRAGDDDLAAAVAALGTEVDDAVGGLDDVEVVLDDEHGVAAVDEALQHDEQLAHVVEVQAGGRLVEDVERAPGAAALQLARELHALRLAAGERRRRLAEVDVAETDVVERLELAPDRRDVLEEVERLLDRHVEDVADVLALVGDLERLAVVARALADLARHVDVGQEVHLDLDLPVALARLAAAARDVEAEAARRVAARLRVRRRREQRADVVPQPGVGGRVRARRAADGRLVDVDDLVDVLEAVEAPVLAGTPPRALQLVRERGRERVGDERPLARAAHAGDDRERAELDVDVDVLEVVLGHAPQLDRALARDGGARPAPGSHAVPTGTRPSATRGTRGCQLACPGRRSRRRARRHPAPCRPRSRPRGSSPRRARRR